MTKSSVALLAISCAMFLALALWILPIPGIQNDEALFSMPLYAAPARRLSLSLHGLIPRMMLMSYLGTVKTWLYRPIFGVFPVSVGSIRLPIVLVCIVTIVLTWVYTNLMAGAQSAAVAAVLLATDPSFLLTGTLDWGPVALQHLFLMVCLLGLAVWLRRGSEPALALCFFACGLGLWDKALFFWVASGVAVATMLVYPREFFARMRVRSAAIALASLCFGALPLIGYNLGRHGATFTQNSSFSFDKIQLKVNALCKTLDGSIMFDVLPASTPDPAMRPGLYNAWGRVSLSIAQKWGEHRSTFIQWGLWGTLLASFGVSRAQTRQMMFLLIAMAIAFCEMSVTQGAGAAAHHEVLLWPLTCIFLAIPFGALAAYRIRILRYASVAVVACLCVGNLLTVNRYGATLLTQGTSRYWTDAIFGLSDAVSGYRGRQFAAVDWGFANGLTLLTGGHVQLRDLSGCLAAATSGGFECDAADAVRQPGLLYIQHTDENEILPGVNKRLLELAKVNHRREAVDRVVYDAHARPVFQIVHFAPTAAGE